MLVVAIYVLLVLPILAGAMRLTARLLGWTLRMAISVVLLPVWIVLALLGGVALAFRALLPLALFALLFSVLLPQQ